MEEQEYNKVESYDEDDESMDSTEEAFMKGYEEEADAEFEGKAYDEDDENDEEEEEE